MSGKVFCLDFVCVCGVVCLTPRQVSEKERSASLSPSGLTLEDWSEPVEQEIIQPRRKGREWL